MNTYPPEATPQRNVAPRSLRALLPLALLLLALLPRTVGLDDFFTTDETYHWVERVEQFSAALARRDWDATNQTGHPGVTLMWLGSGGLALERLALARGAIAPPTPLEHLAWLRLPHALLEALFVPLAYMLLRRLLDGRTALIATLFWATSPYLIAHARLLHLDALLTSFVTFSLLLLLKATNDQRPMTNDHLPMTNDQRWALLGSGFCAGLALLTKGPALILLPFVGLAMLVQLLCVEREKAAAATYRQRLIAALAPLLARYLLWLTAALLTAALLWPALWDDPQRALHSYVEEISANGGRPNGDGQFFFGHAVADPGALFYPVADAFRMTPLMFVGLLLFVACTILRCTLYAVRCMIERRAALTRHRTVLTLGLFIVFWTLVMTMGPKKFDRYVLPTWPALLILAAVGWTTMYDWLRRPPATDDRRPTTDEQAQRVKSPVASRQSRTRFSLLRQQGLLALGACFLALVELAQPLLAHPYYISYYNPLLGGGAVAQRVLLVGWGEGLDRVGAVLRARPDIGHAPVLSALPALLRPFVPVPVRDVDELDKAKANYAVVYRESTQRGANPAIYARIAETVPVARVTLRGIDYALIYQLPKPFARAVGARYGDWLRLRGVTIARSSGRLLITPAWDVRAAPAADYQVFLHLLDAQGRRVAQVDVAPGGARPTRAWQAGEQIAVPLDLALPADLPRGSYQLVLGLYEQATGARQPFTGATAADVGRAGPHALLLDTLTLP